VIVIVYLVVATVAVARVCQIFMVSGGAPATPSARETKPPTSDSRRTDTPGTYAPAYSYGTDMNISVYGMVDRVLAWASDFDIDGNALFCSDELRKMPATAAQFVPGFYRRRAMLGVRQGCLRYIQMEATLYVLPCTTLAAITREHSRDGPRYEKETASYKFQEVPDYLRRVPWPFVSQEGLEGAATFTYHGSNAVVSQSWSSSDVQAGDIISVRGTGVSQEFWRWRHPLITVRYIVMVQTETEDVTPGVYHNMTQSDDRVALFYSMNHDEPHAGIHPKYQPIPIGQLYRNSGRDLLAAHRSAPPWSDSSRTTLVLWMLSVNSRERQDALRVLSKNLGSILQQRDYTNNVFEVYKTAKFVVSPYGAGPDCHRTWEVLAMGAVPIVRSHAGLNPLFAGQAVVIVKSWLDVTPDFLDAWSPPLPNNKTRNPLWLGKWYSEMAEAQRQIVAPRTVAS